MQLKELVVRVESKLNGAVSQPTDYIMCTKANYGNLYIKLMRMRA